jgi:hypothetical protein
MYLGDPLTAHNEGSFIFQISCFRRGVLEVWVLLQRWSVLKERSRVRQKHNCHGIVFIAAMVTTCFGPAWPSSGHNVDVLHK